MWPTEEYISLSIEDITSVSKLQSSAFLMTAIFVCFVDVEFLPDGLSYYPILYFNDYWNLNQDYMPVNSTTKLAPICILCVVYISFTKFK